MGLKYDYREGQTPLDEDEKNDLKIKSITTLKELDEFEQLNIEKAIIWTIRMKVGSKELLTEEFVRKVHYKMFSDVWRWAGEFRKTNKNIGVEWNQIGVELKKLLDDTDYWIEAKTYSEEEIAIRFKHRLVSIHCFPNGNGRHSRILADIILEKLFNKEPFSWNQNNKSNHSEIRKNYISALKLADQNELKPLIDFALAK